MGDSRRCLVHRVHGIICSSLRVALSVSLPFVGRWKSITGETVGRNVTVESKVSLIHTASLRDGNEPWKGLTTAAGLREISFTPVSRGQASLLTAPRVASSG
eukprot:gene3423-biopygen21744